MIKVGDKVGIKGKPYCGIQDLVVFWDYTGIVESIWEIPEHEAFVGYLGKIHSATPRRTRARVLRDLNDPTSWFAEDLDNLELI